VATAHLAAWLEPQEVVADGPFEHGGAGFLPTGHLPDDAAKRRVPTRRLRMQVLQRDNYRCVICRRRPVDHLDLELHVHHVILWRYGGATAAENLVTLCGACHIGLDPDYQPFLRGLAGLPGPDHPFDMDDYGR
jgi:hypothetical protein